MEPNHTHFLLFDDEISDVETINCKRQNIERELSLGFNSKMVGYRQWNGMSDQLKFCPNNPKTNQFILFLELCNPIPIVILLLGGNRATLRIVCDGLENGTPLVVIRVCISTRGLCQ